MTYSFDTSSLVEPWRRAYPPDVFLSLWEDHLPGLIAASDLRATHEVRVELDRQDDDLLKWAVRQDDLFLEVTEAAPLAAARGSSRRRLCSRSPASPWHWQATA